VPTAVAQPAGLLTLAFDPAISPPADEVSERIIDAALELAAASGLGNLTMDDVARRAGVGRMTVYRRFGEKQALVEALGVRETRRALAQIAEAVNSELPAEEQIADGLVAALRIATQHPLLVRFARFEPEALLEPLRAEDGLFLAALREFVAAQIRAGERAGELEVADPEVAAELLVRIGASFVLMPRSVIDYADEDAARELARTLLAPMVAPGRSTSTPSH
jgi:AcrR family transcriptional regulator